MNWEAIGAIGEIIGALAVVISLAYLAIQIRAQNKESRLAAVHEILVGFRESMRSFSSGDLTEIFVKANNDFDSLSDSEALKLYSGVLPMIRLWEEAYIQNDKGRLENQYWEGINCQYSSYLDLPAFARVWKLRGKHFDKNFQNFVNSSTKSEYLFR